MIKLNFERTYHALTESSHIPVTVGILFTRFVQNHSLAEAIQKKKRLVFSVPSMAQPSNVIHAKSNGQHQTLAQPAKFRNFIIADSTPTASTRQCQLSRTLFPSPLVNSRPSLSVLVTTPSSDRRVGIGSRMLVGTGCLERHSLGVTHTRQCHPFNAASTIWSGVIFLPLGGSKIKRLDSGLGTFCSNRVIKASTSTIQPLSFWIRWTSLTRSSRSSFGIS